MEELRLDYSQITRAPYVNMDCDASSCYDRILIPIASLAGRGYGIHRNVIFIHAQTLEEARYKLKTTHGISKDFYQHCVKFPLHGSGQGSGNSPVIWCFISCKLFQAYDTKANGITFSSPNGDISLRISIIGFVDDSTCITGGKPEGTLQELLTRMEADAQLWNDLLWSSGGKLELPKCSYHVVYYDFEPSGVPVMRHVHNYS